MLILLTMNVGASESVSGIALPTSVNWVPTSETELSTSDSVPFAISSSKTALRLETDLSGSSTLTTALYFVSLMMILISRSNSVVLPGLVLLG